MTTKTKTSKTPKTGTKGSAARRKTTTPLGNTRAVDDNSFVPPKKSKKADEPKPVTLAEALAESGQTMDELRAPEAAPAAERTIGTSNLANTIRGRRQNYVVALHPNGKKTQNAGDAVAQLLLNVTLDDLKAFSAARFEGKTYDHLNAGHARMCIGNLIRGALSNGDESVLQWMLAKQPKQADSEGEVA